MKNCKKKKYLIIGLIGVLLLCGALAAVLLTGPFGSEDEGAGEETGEQLSANGIELPRTTLTEGVTYVSEHCLYMSPLSSTLALAGDSGYAYTWSEEGLTRTYLPSGGSTLLKAKSGWEDFPWTDEEWNDMFMLGGVQNPGNQFETMRVMTLENGVYLMDMDGSLWYASISQHPDGTPYVWSIFTLIPAEEKGSTVIRPEAGDDIRIRVEAEHKSLMVDVTGYRDVGEEEDTYVSEHWTAEAGEIVSWSHYSEEGSMRRATMHLHLSNGERATTAATLYFIKEESGAYRVIPVGTDRVLTAEGDILVLH